jgi:F-type H+-transporting ATPase subunit delta
MAVLAEAARGGRGEQIAEDLNAVAHLVSRTNDLALAMTDFAVPAPARKAVLQDLLEERVDTAALKIVLRAVDTERVEELPTALHELYELAHHVQTMPAESLRALEPVVSRTAWRDYMAGYAEAVLAEVPQTADLENIEDELFRFARVIEASPALGSALADLSVSVEHRHRIVDDLLEHKVHAATLQLVHLVLYGRARDIVSSVDWLCEKAAQARGWRIGRVHSALPLGDQEQRQLAEALERLTGQPVELQIMSDPGAIGGAVIEIGDVLVDASLRRRLEQVQEHLLQREGATRGADH